VIDEAAEVIAVTLLRKAYEHLPPERTAGAVNLANIEPLKRALKAMILEGYSAGVAAGEKKGRRELEAEMTADWGPIARRVRGTASSLSFAELELLRYEPQDDMPEYTGGPVKPW
jgi:hypothetical protein